MTLRAKVHQQSDEKLRWHHPPLRQRVLLENRQPSLGVDFNRAQQRIL